MHGVSSYIRGHAPTLRLGSVAHSFAEGAAERSVLRGVDLEVAAGELVAVLGRSGSGKSTLLQLIAGLESPRAGSVQVCGREITTLDEATRTRFRRDHIGFVFQFFHLLPTLTVQENVLLPLELAGRSDAAARARVDELLERVGLADRARTFPDVLSGGEQQRVALARAVVSRPALLLADEPTGNLDEQAATLVLDLLVELSGECAVVIATHSHAAAARCGRVLRVEAGKLVPYDLT